MTSRNQQLQQYTGWLWTVTRGMAADDRVEDLVQEGYIAMWRALGTFDPERGALPAWLTSRAYQRMLDVRNGKVALTGHDVAKQPEGFTTGRGNATRDKIAAILRDNPAATGRFIATTLGMSEGAVSYQRSKMGVVAAAAAAGDAPVSLDALLDASAHNRPGGGDNESQVDRWLPSTLIEGPAALSAVEVAYHAGEIAAALDSLTPAQRRYVIERFWHGKTTAELKASFGYDPTSLWRTAKPRLAEHLHHLSDLINA